jgi:hypothetical protein
MISAHKEASAYCFLEHVNGLRVVQTEREDGQALRREVSDFRIGDATSFLTHAKGIIASLRR